MITVERPLIEEKVKDIIGIMGFSAPEDINQEDNLEDDYGIDSLDIADLELRIETEFSIKIPDGALQECKTVGSVVDYLDGILNPLGI